MTTQSISTLAVRSLRSALVLGAALASVSLGFAQTRTLQVKVPFSFEDGSRHRPAGTYRISLTSDHMISLQSASGSSGGFVMTNPEEKLNMPTKSTVTFHHVNGQYFLREIWVAGNTTGHRCLPSRAEKQVEVGKNTDASLNTVVALNVLP